MRRPTSISTYSISSTASRTSSRTTICHGGARPPPVRRSKTYTCTRPSRARSAWRWSPGIDLLRERHQGHGIDQAVGQYEVAVGRDRSIAHDVAAARDRPALELLRFGIEAHDGVRPGFGLAVPEDIVDRRDAVGRGLRPARRRPFAHLAGRGVEAAEVAARIVGVPDHLVARDRDAPRARARVRELVLADREQ